MLPADASKAGGRDNIARIRGTFSQDKQKGAVHNATKMGAVRAVGRGERSQGRKRGESSQRRRRGDTREVESEKNSLG